MNIAKHFIYGLAFASVFIALPSAHAGVGRDRATGQAIWDAAISGRTTNIGTDGGAWKVIGPAGAATAGTAAGSAKIAGTGVAVVDGKKVPVNISSGDIAKDVIVGAVSGCLTGSVAGCVIGTLTPLALGYMSLSGLRPAPSGSGMEYTDPKVCTVAPCYNYQYTTTPQNLVDVTPEILWLKVKAKVLAANPTATLTLINCDPVGLTGFCRYSFYLGSSNIGNQTFQWTRVSVPPASSTWYPATPQQVKDALYVNDPPVGIVDELAKLGNIIWPLGNTGPTVTGPASIDGPKNVTTNPDGSTVTKQDKTNYSYDGPNVTRSGTTTTTTTKAPDGTTTSTTTSTTTESAGDQSADQPKDEAPTDTALPPVPDLYTRKYPEGIVGIWNQKKAQLSNTDLVQLATGLMPSVGSGGSCPSWSINLNLKSTWAYGTHEVAPPCWIWDVAKAILIFSALLLARALIFGG